MSRPLEDKLADGMDVHDPIPSDPEIKERHDPIHEDIWRRSLELVGGHI
jgi:hypothetical protein